MLPWDIMPASGYKKVIVYRTMAKINAGENVQRRLHKPGSDRNRTLAFVAGLKRSINANPSTPMTKLACEVMQTNKEILMPWIARH